VGGRIEVWVNQQPVAQLGVVGEGIPGAKQMLFEWGYLGAEGSADAI